MKFIFLTAVLTAFFCLAASAQSPTECPKISVATGGQVPAGETMSFTARVEGFRAEGLIYKWSITSGTISEGQGTPTIKVDTTGLFSDKVTATVEIEGLSAVCPRNGSETGAIIRNCDPIPFDEYEKAALRAEKTKLDAVASELEKNAKFTAYFILFEGNEKNPQSLKIRSENISRYLTVTKKVSKDRFQIVVGGKTGVSRTQIWLGAPCD